MRVSVDSLVRSVAAVLVLAGAAPAPLFAEPQVAGSASSSLLLRNDRTVWQWGSSAGGNSALPVPVYADGAVLPLRASMIAAGTTIVDQGALPAVGPTWSIQKPR